MKCEKTVQGDRNSRYTQHYGLREFHISKKRYEGGGGVLSSTINRSKGVAEKYIGHRS